MSAEQLRASRMLETVPSCATCIHAHELERAVEPEGVVQLDEPPPPIECHAHPPQATTIVFPERQEDHAVAMIVQHFAAFPQVARDTWCGDYLGG